MRSRKDYAKEFELVVKQEIKNYNDTVLSTNMSLDKSKKAIEDLSKEMNRKFAEIESKFLSQSIELDLIKKAFDKLNNHLTSRIGDQDLNIYKSKTHLEHSINDIKTNFQEKAEFIQAISNIRKKIDNIFSEMDKIRVSLSHEIERCFLKSKNELDKFKKELADKPSEAQKVKQELEKKIEISSVNSEGIMRELQVHKKSVMIVEKHIENIYTLLERVNKRISS